MESIYRYAERVIIWLGEAAYDTDQIMDHIKRLEKEDDKQYKNSWVVVENSLTPDRKDLLIRGLELLL